MKILSSRPYIFAELLTMTLLMPAAIVHFGLIKYMLALLWVVAIYCLYVLRRTTGERLRDVWRRGEINRKTAKSMLGMLLISALFLGAATAILLPEELFSFMREKPKLWALVMVAYPLVSVLPQEIIFRMFFFSRYKHLFTKGQMIVLASGLAFGFAHIIFENWVAPLLTAIGGILFALTYARSKSLALVSLEHALYGDFIFTIGLGYYFYHGTVGAVASVAP